MSPEGKTSLMVEVPYSFGDAIDAMSDAALQDHVRRHMVECGFITDADIMDMVVKRLLYAYPVLEKAADEPIERLKAYFDGFDNLYQTGRSGRFVYSWTHNMMRYAKDFVDGLRGGGGAREARPAQGHTEN